MIECLDIDVDTLQSVSTVVGIVRDDSVLCIDIRFAGGVPVPPVFSNINPAPGTPIAPAATLSARVSDTGPIAKLLLWVEYPNGKTEVMFAEGTFLGGFTGTMVPLGSGNGYDFSVKREGGFPFSPKVHYCAVDFEGGVA